MIRLVALLDKVFSLIQILYQNLRNKKAQDERDKLESDPHTFFTDHFSGVSDAKHKTIEADKTNINHSAK